MAVSSGPQYGSLERAWGAIMTEADKVSELHQEVKNNLLNEDLEKVKNWQKDAYHKQIMGGFKETKEAEDGFRKAQKPWAKKIKEVPGGSCQEGARLGGWGQRGRPIRGRVSHRRRAGHHLLGLRLQGSSPACWEEISQGGPCGARQEGVPGAGSTGKRPQTGGPCS